jgi:HD superfamily phosphodiesterase
MLMLKLFEHLKLDAAVNELFTRTRAELLAKDNIEVWNHTLRVINNLYAIKELVEFDFRTALISAIIHDIGYNAVVTNHDKTSAVMMKSLLDRMLDADVVNAVIHAVESHECDGDIKPQTIEAMALHDADMMDYCMEVGIINAFILGTSLGLSKAKVSNRIVNAINEGFLIKQVKVTYQKQLVKTEEFFINLVSGLNKERTDFVKYGIDRVQ